MSNTYPQISTKTDHQQRETATTTTTQSHTGNANYDEAEDG